MDAIEILLAVIIGVLLLVIMSQSVQNAKSVPPEIVQTLVDTLVQVAKITPGKLDDEAASALQKYVSKDEEAQ